MPKKLEVDYPKLVAAIQDGTPQKQIMKDFGLNTAAQVKAAYLEGLIGSGAVPAIVSSRGGPKTKETSEKEARVSKRGSIALPKEMVEELGYQIGDAFMVRKTKVGVSLKKI